MPIKYAQIDSDGYVTGISFLSGQIDSPQMIVLDESEEVEIGMKRVGVAWEPDDRPELDPEMSPLESKVAEHEQRMQLMQSALDDLILGGGI